MSRKILEHIVKDYTTGIKQLKGIHSKSVSQPEFFILMELV